MSMDGTVSSLQSLFQINPTFVSRCSCEVFGGWSGGGVDYGCVPIHVKYSASQQEYATYFV
jgi:hypothetical protein